MESPNRSILGNAFLTQPESTVAVETEYRCIQTPLPAPDSLDKLARAVAAFPQVNCYQPPIVWDRAEGATIYDAYGNRWIDFTSTAVMTNTGHGHPSIRERIASHANAGLLGQFSFASEIRIELAERLLEWAPDSMDRVYFWTVGSEAIEAAFRVVRHWATQQSDEKHHILTFQGDFHGWTMGAHKLSGASSTKPWLPYADPCIHHLSFPAEDAEGDEDAMLDLFCSELDRVGVAAKQVAGVFVEALQGWGAIRHSASFMRAVRRWTEQNGIQLIFDEIQTGFGRTGRLFAFEHYGIEPDMICVGKGLSSTLPIAAVIGRADVLDTVPPGDITTTHAAHPLSCAASLANLDVIEKENLIDEAARKGELARQELQALAARFPSRINRVSGVGLVQAIHLQDPETREPDRAFARDLTWAAVKRGVMLFQVNRPTIKVCPPLVIDDAALVEGIQAIAEAIETIG